VAATGSNKLWWWDVKTLKVRSVEPGGSQGVAFTPDGNQLVVSAGGKFKFFSTASSEMVREINNERGLQRPYITADGKILGAAAHPHHHTELFSVETGKPMLVPPPVIYMATAPTGQRIAATAYNTLWVWDVAFGRKEYRFGAGVGGTGVFLGPPT